MLAAFLLSCMMYQTKAQLIEDNAIQIYPYNAQIAAQSDETPAAEEQQATASNLSLYGQCRVTFYCPCSTCCGSWGNATASGVMPTPNHTVATGSLPFGTVVVIDGAEYVVEDRGVGAYEMDIFVSDHQEALNRGLYYTDVFIKG